MAGRAGLNSAPVSNGVGARPRVSLFVPRRRDRFFIYDRPLLLWVNDMDTTFDIFMRLADAGPPLWIETVTTLELEDAKRRLAALSSKECGTYMVFDWRLGTFIDLLESLPSNPLSTKPGRFSFAHN